MKKAYLLSLIILSLLYISAAAGTNEDYRNILEKYDNANPSSSIATLKSFITKNPDFKPAYLQLFSWCRLSNEYSAFADFRLDGEPSEVFLLGIYNFINGKKEEGVKLMSEVLVENGTEIDESFGFHFCDFLDTVSNENFVLQIKEKIANPKEDSEACKAALTRTLYDSGNFTEAAKILESAIRKFPKSLVIQALYTMYQKEISIDIKTFSVKDNRDALSNLTNENPFTLAIINYLDGAYLLKIKSDEGQKKLSDSEAMYEKYGFVTFKPELFLLKASALRSRQDYKNALQKLNSIKPLLEKIGVRQYLFSLYLALGDIYTIAGRYEDAFQYFTTAKKNIIHNGNKLFFHQSLCSFYLMLRKNEDCLNEARTGLALAEKTDNNTFKIAFYTQLVNILNELGNFDEALENAEKALATLEKEDNKFYLVPILASKANTLQFMGRYADSRNAFLEALKASEKHSTKISSAKIIGSLGMISVKTNELKKAKEYLNKAADIFREFNDKYNLAITIGNLGEAYQKGSEFYKALKSFQEAIKLTQELRDIRSSALFYAGMGSVYQKLGNYERALEIFKEAEKIYQELNSKHYLGEYYTNLAGIYYDMNDFKNAELYDQKAIDLFKELNEQWSLLNVYSNVFVTAWTKKDIKKMTSAFKSTQELAGLMKDSYVNNEVSLMEGALLNKKGKSAEARAKLSPILSLMKSYNQRAAWANFEMGLSYKIEKNYKTALDYFNEAIKLIEKERQALRLSGEVKGFFERNRIYYDEYFETLYLLYIKSGDKSLIDDLFSTVEQLKERNFSDSLAESRASLERYISTEMKDKELNILGRISYFNTNVNYAENDEQLQAALEGRNYAERDLDELKMEIRSKNPGYARLVYPASASAVEAKKILDSKDSTLISYLIQNQYLYIIFITQNDVKIIRTKEAANVVSEVKNLLNMLKTPDPSKIDRLKTVSASLFKRLLLPIQKNASLGKNLIIIPDEILYYLPFDVLIKQNGKYMIEEHTITYGPSATSLLMLDPPKHTFKNELFAVANPAMTRLEKTDDSEAELLTGERGFDSATFSTPLPYSEDEIKNISSLFGNNKYKTLIGKNASEEIVKSEDLSDYRFLHFATHGIFDETNPYRSGLIFSMDDDPVEDGLLQYREIYGLKTDAELIVLSACKTGLGKIAKGEGLIGISRGFMISGAQSVVVSLWNVSDLSTAFMMNEFYKNILVRKLPKSEALRQAKMTLIRMQTGEVSHERGISGITPGRKASKTAGFSHPYFWGPFIIIGSSK